MARTKERNHTFADSGISVKDSIILSVNNEMLPLKRIILVIMTFAGVFGSMFSFLSYFDFQYDKKMFIIYNLIFFAVFSFILNLPNKMKLFIFPICLLYETIFVRQRDDFINGFKAMYNVIAKAIHLTYGDIMYYRLDKSIDIVDSTTVFLLLSSFVLSLLVCYFTYCTSLFPLGIALTFFLVETGLYFGFAPFYPAFILVLVYWIFITANGLAGYHSSSEKNAGFVRNGNRFYAKANIKFRVGEFSGLASAIISLVLFTASMIAVNLTGYERSQKIDDLRYDIKKSVSEFSIENIPDSMNKLAMSLGNFSAAPGKLGQFSNISFDNEVDFSISFDVFPQSELYLKCFTGSYYSKNEWTDFPKETYKKYEYMFKDFETGDIFPQNFLYTSLKYGYKHYEYTENHAEIKFLNEKNKYLYLPYGTDTEPFSRKYDTNVSSENTADYSFDFRHNGSYEKFMSTVNYAEANNDNNYQSFIDAENTYLDYVYSEYLQLPDNENMKDIKAEFADVIANAEKRSSASEYYTSENNDGSIDIIYNCDDIYATLSEIRSAVSKNTEYTLSPGRTPSTRDFTAYFLLENKKGYCSHYASAGIILARMCGIPARYAEGYIITENDLLLSKVSGNSTVEVKDSRSHAWAEVYISGLGWVPFEFTPGYESGLVAAESEMTKHQVSIILPPELTETSAPATEIPADNTEEYTEETYETVGETEEETEIAETSEEPEPVYTVITSDNSSDDTHDIISKITENKLLMGIIFLIAGIIALIIIIVLAVNIKRKFVLSKRKRIFEKGSPNEAALTAYHYIISLLAFEGIVNDSNMHHLEFAEYAEKSSKYLKEEEFTEVMYTALKSDLSNQEITKEEAEKIIALAKRICKETEANADKNRRFRMRYVLNLS